jgi:nucleoside-diphosphate-sugar epimerase
MGELALVTGGTGFLGRELVRRLRAEGLRCICISRKRSPDEDTVTLDLEHGPAAPAAIAALLAAQRPALIFHLAATTTTGSGIFASNLLPLLNLLDAIERVPDYSPRVMVAGSAAEYGDLGSNPLEEGAREAPVTDYGVAKLAQTKLALARRRKGQNILIARIFNALGPGMPATLAPGRFVQSALALRAQSATGSKKATSLTTGDLSPVRDYLDVQEIAGALLLLSRTDTKGTAGIVNICSGQPTRMQGLLDEILLQLGMDITPERDPRLLKGPSEIPVSLGSTELLRRLTGTVLPFDLKASVSRLLAAD